MQARPAGDAQNECGEARRALRGIRTTPFSRIFEAVAGLFFQYIKTGSRNADCSIAASGPEDAKKGRSVRLSGLGHPQITVCSQRRPPEKMMVSKLRFRVGLMKFFITAPGWHDTCCPTLTCVRGIATQVFFPLFSRQT